MYCTVPENGGHTNFRNANVHVKPKAGSAVFFSYIDPEELVMDTGFTEHSGCPVLEGEKKIVTQWVRLGVDANYPWTSFNTRTYIREYMFFLFITIPQSSSTLTCAPFSGGQKGRRRVESFQITRNTLKAELKAEQTCIGQ